MIRDCQVDARSLAEFSQFSQRVYPIRLIGVIVEIAANVASVRHIQRLLPKSAVVNGLILHKANLDLNILPSNWAKITLAMYVERRFTALMLEAEVKFLEIDKKDIIQRLEDMGAEELFRGEMMTVYYDTKNGTYDKQNQRIRLRDKEGAFDWAVKEKLICEDIRLYREDPVVVHSMTRMDENLRAMKLEKIRTIYKDRLSFVLPSRIQVDIDSIKNIPTWLEIEQMHEETEDLEEVMNIAKKAIKRTAKLLGLSMKDAKPWSTMGVLREYDAQHLVRNGKKH